MEEDPLTLARISVTNFNETPLHVAAMLGHAAFAKALVRYQPNLVRELDSHGCSPLHVASANGYVEIVKMLLMEDSSVCHVRDQDRRTPLHLAVMKGRGDVIRELVSAQEQVTRYTLDRGETILHLCVKHNHLEALKRLVELGGDLANAQDHNGNTILHTATTLKQMETMKYLLREPAIVKVNALNANGFTALDVIQHMPRDIKSVDIRDLLVTAGALRAIDLSPVSRATNPATRGDDHDNGITTSQWSGTRMLAWWKKIRKVMKNDVKKQHAWLEKKYDALLVAATLIAAMAYQAALSPPGGLWEDDKTVEFGGNKNITFYAGTSLMAAHFPLSYQRFWIFNTMSFVAAMSVVFLVASANGYVKIVKLLLTEDSRVCHVPDQDERTPLHLAVMKGRGDVINELISAQEQVTRYTLDGGETILHLCVKHNNLEAIKRLLELTLKYLLREPPVVRVNALNANGFTALDVIQNMPTDKKSVDIRNLLVAAGAQRARDLTPATTKEDHDNGISSFVPDEHRALVPRRPRLGRSTMTKRAWWKKMHKIAMNRSKKQHIWLEKKYDSLLIAATLIATMAYQAAINPPGGLWQEDIEFEYKGMKNKTFYAGTFVMAANYPEVYETFWKYNTTSFVAALSVVLLLVNGLPLKQRIFAWLLMATMLVAMTFMALTYLISMRAVTPGNSYESMMGEWSHKDPKSMWKPILKVVKISVYTWFVVVGAVLLVHSCRFLMWITGIFRRYRNKRVSSPMSNGEVAFECTKLMEEDRLTLARISVTNFNETPLHVAAMLGHAAFAKALVGYQPNLVRELDSQGCSPLHLASANGYVEIVKLLLMEDSSICHVRDQDGRTPLHLAAMKGRGDVIRELASAQEQVMRYTLDRGETILHLCVEYNHLEALKQLAEYDGIDDDLLNVQDHNGNTILHTATALKQMETMKYLLREPPVVRVNALNANGFTALDVIQHMPRDMKSVDIRDLLVTAGALKAIHLSPVSRASNPATTGDDHDNGITTSQRSRTKMPAWWKKIRKVMTNRLKKQHTWLEKKYDALLVAATLIAAMAYQAALNPPGGLWQDDKTVDLGGNKNITFYAGTSLLAAHHPYRYGIFWIYNTTSFVAALSVVFLVVSGLPLKRRIFAWLLMAIMSVAVTSMAATYVQSMIVLTPGNIVKNWTDDDFTSMWKPIVCTVGISVVAWITLVGVVLVVHICRFLMLIARILCRRCRKKRDGRTPLHLAVMKGRCDVIKELISAQQEVTWYTLDGGETILHLCVKHNHLEALKRLLELGRDLENAQDHNGNTILHTATALKQMEGIAAMSTLARQQDEKARLVEKDAQAMAYQAALNPPGGLWQEDKTVNLGGNTTITFNGGTSLMAAHSPYVYEMFVICNTSSFVAALSVVFLVLMEEDRLTLARISVTSFNETPLHVAAMLGHAAFAKALVGYRPNLVRELDSQGCSPLHLASANGYIEMPELKEPKTCLQNHAPPTQQLKEMITQNHKACLHWWKKMHKVTMNRSKKRHTWLERKYDSLLIAATLIATMAYQAAINPSGGLWQEDQTFVFEGNRNITFYAGTSVMAANYPGVYETFWSYNTSPFVAALSTVLLLVSGLPLKRRIFAWLLMAIMWVAMTFMALTYLISMTAVTPGNSYESMIEEWSYKMLIHVRERCKSDLCKVDLSSLIFLVFSYLVIVVYTYLSRAIS
ncbi:hypothetical protein RJ640_021532 [Escallonia rubra]|uniref:PGG domain-containing protein n=1 Tax=Escallonia rubra TaxID=112253 RepID=A0AA88S9R1_9ASTE|nr:hypothetical protein RJ640_021532 [Escallonia rubra]